MLPTTPPPPSTPASARHLRPMLRAGFVCGHTTAIGDSVMLDAEPDLQADIPGIDVEAAVSRQWDDGVALAQQMKADGTLGSIVVIDLGTNGPVDSEQFQQMMSALAGASVVVFVTVHLPPSYSWWQSVNATLEQGVPDVREREARRLQRTGGREPSVVRVRRRAHADRRRRRAGHGEPDRFEDLISPSTARNLGRRCCDSRSLSRSPLSLRR